MKFFYKLIALLMIASCVSRIEKHGYMFEMSDYEMVKEGVTSKERVLNLMGSPTIIESNFNEDLWIYFSEDVRHFLFFKPKPISRKIVVLDFDELGVVKKIDQYLLRDENKKFAFSKETTPVKDHNHGWFKSIYSNVGQVKPQ
jgi:outer membrane protein assembly factor BamE (lipoprotein component of BamABCDE complex)